MRGLTFWLIALLLAPVLAAQSCPLELKGGDAVSVGVYIAPVDPAAAPTVSWRADALMTPASILKSLTTATALSTLGPDFRWTTRVVAVGPISTDGTLQGNLVIIASGDPTLSSRHFSKGRTEFIAAVTEAVKVKGIKRVTGSVLVDESALPGGGPYPTWEVEDVAYDYGAGCFALNYADNTFSLSVPSMTATPPIPGLEIIDRRGATGSLSALRGIMSSTVKLTGSLARRESATLSLSMPSPSAVALERLQSALCRAGVTIEGKNIAVKADTTQLLSYESPTLRDVARSLMVRSDNLMAEATLRALASGKGLSAALATERAYWAGQGVDLTYTIIKDGSGLSRSNAISASQLGAVLRVMAQTDTVTRRAYVDAFARVGVDGTLRSFLAKHARKGEFVLKSGSMGGVQCYAGYRLDPSTGQPTHVIVVMVNNLFGSRTDIRKSIETLLLTIPNS